MFQRPHENRRTEKAKKVKKSNLTVIFVLIFIIFRILTDHKGKQTPKKIRKDGN